MKRLKVKFKYRFFGKDNIKEDIHLVDVENDSNDEEIYKQLDYYFNKFVDNSAIVEVYKPIII